MKNGGDINVLMTLVHESQNNSSETLVYIKGTNLPQQDYIETT
jgi:hypothetical protein